MAVQGLRFPFYAQFREFSRPTCRLGWSIPSWHILVATGPTASYFVRTYISRRGIARPVRSHTLPARLLVADDDPAAPHSRFWHGLAADTAARHDLFLLSLRHLTHPFCARHLCTTGSAARRSSELNITPLRANLGVNWPVLTSHWASASGIWRAPMTSAHASHTWRGSYSGRHDDLPS